MTYFQRLIPFLVAPLLIACGPAETPVQPESAVTPFSASVEAPTPHAESSAPSAPVDVTQPPVVEGPQIAQERRTSASEGKGTGGTPKVAQNAPQARESLITEKTPDAKRPQQEKKAPEKRTEPREEAKKSTVKEPQGTPGVGVPDPRCNSAEIEGIRCQIEKMNGGGRKVPRGRSDDAEQVAREIGRADTRTLINKKRPPRERGLFFIYLFS